MKKFSIYMLAALGFLAASCAEDIEPSTPQTNPQEPILNAANDLSAEPYGALVAAEGQSLPVINLEDYNQPDAVIEVIKLLKAENLPAGSTLQYRIEISKTPDFQSYGTLVPTLNDNNIYTVPAVDWEDMQIQVFGNSPKVQHAYYRVPVYVALDGTDYRVSGLDADGESLGTNYYAFSGEFDITRMTPSLYIADSYQAVLNGGQPVDFSRGDSDPYDDPTFTIAFKVPENIGAAGYTVLIQYVNSAGATEQLGFVPSANNANEGTLEGTTPLKITEAGPYKLVINMEDLTYTIAVAPETLYVPSTGATFNAKCLQLATSDFITYSGVAYIDTHFRLTGQKGWAPVAYGAVDAEAPLANKGEIVVSNNWINVETPADKGLYGMTVNLAKMTYDVTYVKTLGICGEFNGWGKTPDTELTHVSGNFNVWTGELTLSAAGEVKVRANNAWEGIEFGKPATQTVADETQYGGDGSNYSLEAGTYTVTLNVGTLPYTLSFTKK